MRRFALAAWLSALGTLWLSGCAENALVLKGQVDKLQQQQLALSRQNQQFQARADALDRDNQELQTLLAQSRQQVNVVDDQLAAVRDQLRGATEQLVEAREGKKSSDHKVEALTASMRQRAGVSIIPNNSLLKNLPAINLPDVHVRRDADVIRVALPGNRLFESGSARLRGGAAGLIGDAAAELRRIYPGHFLGIEGHTDSDRINSRQWRSNHELSIARAMAVYDVLVHQAGYPSGQLFVVGHGPNHPIHSNATPAGKQGNRRVELVIYPEKAG